MEQSEGEREGVGDVTGGDRGGGDACGWSTMGDGSWDRSVDVTTEMQERMVTRTRARTTRLCDKIWGDMATTTNKLTGGQ